MQRPAERFSAVGRSAGYGGMKMLSVHKPFFLFCSVRFFFRPRQARAKHVHNRSDMILSFLSSFLIRRILSCGLEGVDIVVRNRRRS